MPLIMLCVTFQFHVQFKYIYIRPYKQILINNNVQRIIVIKKYVHVHLYILKIMVSND